MSLSNLNKYQKPEFSVAAMCIARGFSGYPNTDVITRSKSNNDPVAWHDLSGNETSIEFISEFTGLSKSRLYTLHKKYGGDCRKIINNHGFKKVRK